MDELSTGSKASSSTGVASDPENGGWEASLRTNWKPFSLNPWRLFLDCRAAKIITVEPIVLLYMLDSYLFFFTLQQYFFWRFGKEQLANSGFPLLNRSSFCISTDDLNEYGPTNETADDVQTSAGHLVTYSTVPGLLLSVIVALVLGPLSDKYGRRLIFFSMGIGVLVQGVLAFLIIWFEWNIHLFILDTTLASLIGGFARASCFTASFSYAADISSGKWRSIRIAMIEAMRYGGGALSEGIAGVLLQRTECKFWPLIVMYIACGILILAYVAFLLPEPLSRFERQQKASNRPRGFRALARGLKMFLCPSEYSTWKLWLGLIVISIMVSNFIGAQEITAFFLKGEPLKWRVGLIGYYGLVTYLTHGMVLLVITPIFVALSLPDTVIALIGLAFSSGMNIFTGFVKETWEMFVVAVFAGMEAMIIASMKSVMSKEVSAGDQGSLFSIVASAQVFASVASTAFYPNVYPLTLHLGLRPGTSYLIMAAMCAVPAPLLIVLWLSQRGCCTNRLGRSRRWSSSSRSEEREKLLQNKEDDDWTEVIDNKLNISIQ